MNYNDENNVEQNDESQKKRPIRDRLSSAYDRYQDYNDLKEKYNANGLGGLARGMAQEAINNKVNQVKDKAKEKIDAKKDQAKEKINAKKNELKNKAKDKIDSKLPDSVKKKRDDIRNKGQALKDKANNSKKKLNDTKDKIKDAKKNLNENVFRKGVRAGVNAVAPGYFWTALQPACWEAEKIPTLGADAPMKRAGETYEIAPLFVYLASDDASYVTGQVMHINGGLYKG